MRNDLIHQVDCYFGLSGQFNPLQVSTCPLRVCFTVVMNPFSYDLMVTCNLIVITSLIYYFNWIVNTGTHLPLLKVFLRKASRRPLSNPPLMNYCEALLAAESALSLETLNGSWLVMRTHTHTRMHTHIDTL